MVWLIVAAVLLIILILPLGADVAYSPAGFFLAAKAGPLRVGILPKKDKPKKEPSAKQLAKKEAKAKKKAEQKALKKAEKKAKKEALAQDKREHPEKYPKKKPDMELILQLLRVVLRALGRFRLKLSFDLLRFHYTSAGDPYDTAVSYGRVSALMTNLPHMTENVLTVRNWDLDANCDFTVERPVIDLRVILTIQLWEIFAVVLAFAAEAGVQLIKSRSRKRRQERKLKHAESNV